MSREEGPDWEKLHMCSCPASFQCLRKTYHAKKIKTINIVKINLIWSLIIWHYMYWYIDLYDGDREKERDRLWSEHIRTRYLLLYLWLWALNILKKTAVYSCSPFEAKTSKPNGPKPPSTDAPFFLHKIWGSVQLGSSTCAFWKSLIPNVTCTSACKLNKQQKHKKNKLTPKSKQ